MVKQSDLFSSLNSLVLALVHITSIPLIIVFCFYAHNYIRKLHGVPPFRWHSGLGDSALKWAIHLAEQNNGIEHKSGLHVFTENIHEYTGHNATCGVLDAIYSW